MIQVKRARDSQRAKLYRSEVYALGPSGLLHDWAAVKAWHLEVTQGEVGAKLERAFGLAPGSLATVWIRPTPGGRRSRADHRRIHLGSGGDDRTKRMHLHELGHTITERIYPDGSKAWHGPEYCGVLLHIVLIVLGHQVRSQLSLQLSAGKVRVEPWNLERRKREKASGPRAAGR